MRKNIRSVINASALVLVSLCLSGIVSAQYRGEGNLADRQETSTVLGGTGLFNTFSTRTLDRREFRFALFWNNFDRDPGDLDINQIPVNFTVGLTSRWEVWVNWVAWQQVTSRNPFLLSGYQYNAVRRFGDPFDILGPPIGGDGNAAFFPGTEAPAGGILPRLGLFGTPANFTGASLISPGGPGGPLAVGLGPALVTNAPSFYNDLPLFGEIDFIGFDGLGRIVLGPRQSSNGTGDVYAGSKVAIIDPNDSWFSMALGGYLKIPTARGDNARARGRTSGEFEYGPILMFGQESAGKRLRVYENIGYIHTGDIERRGVKILDLRDKLLLSVGASLAVNKYAEIVSELSYTRYVGKGTPSLFVHHPLELNIGARFFLRDGSIAFGGAYRRLLNKLDASDRNLSGLECVEIEEKPPDDHDCKSRHGEGHKDCDKRDKPRTRIECKPGVVRFNEGNASGFVGFFSIGTRKGCPPPPAPSCVLDSPPSVVTRGDRFTVTVRPTTVGFRPDRVSYSYRWEVRDSQGRPLPVNTTGETLDISTSRLDCGSYSVTAVVTASVTDDCGTSEQQTSCSASFEVTEPPCPTVTCRIVTSPARTLFRKGELVRFRASGGGPDLSYTWTTTDGTLQQSTGPEVTLDTTDVRGNSVTVSVRVDTGATRCNEPCPGASCSATVNFEVPPPRVEIIRPCGPLYFPFNSARINNEHKACLLDDVARRMIQDPRSLVVIEGHRDSSERAGISLTRANNARETLINDGNISPSRITVRNFGATCPEQTGRPDLNARVVIWIVPEGASMSQIDEQRECAPGSTPRIITDEEPFVEPARPPRRTPRRGTSRRPEPLAESEGDWPEVETIEPASAPASNYARAGGVRAGAESAQKPATIVRGVRTRVANGTLQVIIDADGAAQFKAFSLAGPSRIVVDITGVRSALGSKTLQVDAGGVDRVRVGEPEPGVVRVVLDVVSRVSYRVMRDGASLIIVVGDAAMVSQFNGDGATPLVTIQ